LYRLYLGISPAVVIHNELMLLGHLFVCNVTLPGLGWRAYASNASNDFDAVVVLLSFVEIAIGRWSITCFQLDVPSREVQARGCICFGCRWLQWLHVHLSILSSPASTEARQVHQLPASAAGHRGGVHRECGVHDAAAVPIRVHVCRHGGARCVVLCLIYVRHTC
jgi:hypothetical protein